MAVAAPEVVRLAEAQLNFSAVLYKEIFQDQDNLVFCPTSIWAVLAMLGVGAKGDTASQIAQALNQPSLDASSEVHDAFERVSGALTDANSPSMEIIIANSLFLHVDFSCLSEYSDLVTKHYQTSVQNVDYQNDKEKACDDINGWVATQTKEKITNLLSPQLLDEYTKLVLVNTVYMKGLWSKQFDPTNTKPDVFYLLDGTERIVDMMYQKGKFRIGKDDTRNSLVLEMPYDGDQLSMIVILPANPAAFHNLEQTLSGDTIKQMLGSLQRTMSVFLWLPSFKAEAKLALHDVLPKLGIENLFAEQSADLSGICGKDDLVVSAILHKSVIIVDEKGSEAAAATAAVMRMKRSMEISEEFHANRPFLYLIRHNQTGTILFLGRLTSPPKATVEPKDEL